MKKPQEELENMGDLDNDCDCSNTCKAQVAQRQDDLGVSTEEAAEHTLKYLD